MGSRMDFESELRRQWAKVAHFEDGAIQLDVEHPLEWYVRRAQKEGKSLVVVSMFELRDFRPSKCIATACEQRRDGRYAISFTLTDASREEVFFTLAADIIAFSQPAQTPKTSIVAVKKRYTAWQRLLDHGRSAHLSKEAQKGLFAELLFLRKIIERGMASVDAVAGWVGPEAADQDFVYPDGWHEVKAVGIASASVTISSLEQLACEGEGELVVYRIDSCAPAYPGALTLRALVQGVRSWMNDSIEALDIFEMKLADAGYLDGAVYEINHFYVAHISHYQVREDFPRLRRADVPREVLNAIYQLDLPGLEPWREK